MRNQFGGHALHTAPPPGGDVAKDSQQAETPPEQAPEAEAAGASGEPKPAES
jgi:hypothetical protein